MYGCMILLAATLLSAGENGLKLELEGETAQIDPARSLFLTLRLTTPPGVKSELPALRDRLRGFSLIEDFAEPARTLNDGSVCECVNLRLVPEPCAAEYAIAPFLVRASPRLLSRQSDDGSLSFVAGPLKFAAPPPREAVTGAMECEVEKDLPPLSWKLVGQVALSLIVLAALAAAVWFAVRYVARRVREHRMSPIERAWVELERLIRKGLPGRGRYKDFYVELTMVVRRYVQRKYDIRAPHLTTEEFFAELDRSQQQTVEQAGCLRRFLESADLVKFAGVEATSEMADEATDSARGYLESDAALHPVPDAGK